MVESHDLKVRVYADTAIVTGRGVVGAQLQGRAFRLVERISCVFVRQEGRWRCVLMHRTRIAEP